MLLPCKRTFREKAVVVVRKLMPYFSIKMITNFISCLNCLDGSDIVHCLNFSIFVSVYLFNELQSFLLVDACLVSSTHFYHTNGRKHYVTNRWD